MAGRLSGEDCMIAILQFTDEQRPGYLETYLNQRDISFRVFRPDSGEALPLLSECSAVALMGGTMEVNDPLPWISDVLSLIREADQRSIPVIGHCLGGQLIARAFGAVVEDNEHYEIGWHQVDISASAQKNSCFSGVTSFTPFHWHYQTFALPVGAELLLSSQFCQHQAFQLRLNLAFQCHIEITEDMVLSWCRAEQSELVSRQGEASVQSETGMMDMISDRLMALQPVSENIYGYWLSLSDTNNPESA